MGRKPYASTSTAKKAEKQAESKDVSSKKELAAVTRRSGRIRNQVPLSQNREIEPVLEINIVEDDVVDEPDDVADEPDDAAYEPANMEIPVHSQRNLEDKVDYIFQAVEELKSKAPRRRDDVPNNELNYKSLYIDSQKQVETLTKANYELSKKAEVAVAKMEGYAEATQVWSEVLGQVKDVFVASKSPKATQNLNKVGSLTNASDVSAPSEVAADVAIVGVETQPRATRQKRAKLSDGN